MANPLKELNEYGQSVWLDFVSRELLQSGGLKRLIADDGVRGVTSNPSIFEKAIGHGDDYDDLIKQAEAAGDLDPGALFETLAIGDIRDGADALAGVYKQTQGRDGYISLEVSPYLAMQTDATIEEAHRLWHAVDRPNLMIKVPATKAGLPAIRKLIGDGINVNITLLFAQPVYAEVADAYIAGLEDFVAKGGDPRSASRASPASSSAASTRWSMKRSTKRSPRRAMPRRGSGSRRSRARSPSPTPSLPISSPSASTPASAGSAWRNRVRRPSGSSGPAPGPRTRPTAM